MTIMTACICVCLENDIDGGALVALPEDFNELKTMIPQSGLRLHLKSLIRDLCRSFEYTSYSGTEQVYSLLAV